MYLTVLCNTYDSLFQMCYSAGVSKAAFHVFVYIDCSDIPLNSSCLPMFFAEWLHSANIPTAFLGYAY